MSSGFSGQDLPQGHQAQLFDHQENCARFSAERSCALQGEVSEPSGSLSLNARLKNMSLELELDRELLARKNRQLQFLNTLLHQASTTLDLDRILEVVHSVIDDFIELEVSCALFWYLDEEDQAHGDLYIPHCLAEGVQGLWTSHLLDQARSLLSRPIADYQLNTFAAGGSTSESQPGQSVFTFPLQVHNKLFGCLGLKPVDPHVGQDTYQSLSLAAQHLALIFQNAKHFAQIRKEADHDGLTQINNRQHFDKRLNEEIKRHLRHGQPFSLLMLDVDHFKDINDTFGHQAGDMVLQSLGRLLTTSLRASDFSARYGGEEFSVILPQTAREQALKLAERLRKEVADREHLFEGQTFSITVSLGVASFDPSSPTSPYTIVSRADRALYRAKQRGRNTVVCTSEDHDVLFRVDKSTPPSQTERHEHA